MGSFGGRTRGTMEHLAFDFRHDTPGFTQFVFHGTEGREGILASHSRLYIPGRIRLQVQIPREGVGRG